jgi:putative pyruvate formate lyase activating enzyme
VTSVQLPGYLALHGSGELERRAEAAWRSLSHCELCPHRCGADRLHGERGRCRSPAMPMVASANLHAWEEPPISGTRGSGTIFFSGCTGRCRFCQNYPISQLGVGREVSLEELAQMMVRLQERGAHNINFVTPTHYVAAILGALPMAIERGLCIPLLYNSSGFEWVDTLRQLEGVIDIWLPDAKYASEAVGRSLSGFPDYPLHNRSALREMYRQVGDPLEVDQAGIALRGLIVRHMVLPHGLAGTREVLLWIAANLSTQVHVSLMSQYFPAYRCVDDDLLGRKVTAEEYEEALAALDEAGLEDGWVQEQDECEADVEMVS